MAAASDRSVLILLLSALLTLSLPALAVDDPQPEADAARMAFLQQALASVPPTSGDRSLSPYFFVRCEGDGSDRLPLKAVDAQVSIAGVIAQVRLTQTYENQGQRPIEAIYLFPASTRAAVEAMKMTIGKRVIQAAIKERGEALKDYEQARQEGRSASLLEQQRPNVFQMSVANILPGDRIEVELTYTELLVPEDKQYEFVLPTVVGPRYSNQAAKGAAETERWVENPYLKEGEQATTAFELKVQLNGGLPIAKVGSPSHRIEVEYADRRSACISLKADPANGTKDFVLRYSMAGEGIEQGLLLYEGEDENFFLLMMEPPAREEKTDLLSREYLFVLDVSGSMDGFPLETSKALMTRLMRDLRSYDHFNILLFAGGSRILAPRSLPATRANLRKAEDWLRLLSAGGGTELVPALRRALAMPRPDKVSRSIVILTDGYVNVEKEAFSLIRERLGEANLFAFGIGSSVNRFLIEGLARAGAGEPFVVLEPNEAEAQAEKFRRYISAPLMRGIAVEFDGFEAYDLDPAALPDLFADRPVVVMGKYRNKRAGQASGRVIVRGQGSSGEVRGEMRIKDAIRTADNAALRTLWARQRVGRLADFQQLDPSDVRKKEVTELGLRYGLLTEFTSFVAIDSLVRADGQKVTTVRQPLPLPAGVSNRAVGNMGLLGALGTSGHGGIGSGAGYGSSFGAAGVGGLGHARVRSPRIMARATVAGSMSRGVIQQVIRKNTRAIRLLYERQLKSKPKLQGKVVVEMTIGADGKVAKAIIRSSSMKDPAFEQAMLQIVRRWRFPAPAGGGQVVVSYPFIFHSAP